MNYIKDNIYNIETDGEIIYISVASFLNELCIKNFSTLLGREEAIRKVFDFKYKVPIFINKDNIFIRIMMIYFNYVNVLKVMSNNKKTLIVFKDLNQIEVDASIKTISKHLKRVEKIVNYLRQNDYTIL